jgi:hypothetical protein
MEKPPIQYVMTSDGVSIAYYSVGDGPGLPVVWVDLPSHLNSTRFLSTGVPSRQCRGWARSCGTTTGVSAYLSGR